MYKSVSQFADHLKNNPNEINNNSDFMRRRNDSQVRFSNGSRFDSSEETFQRRSTFDDVIGKAEDRKFVSCFPHFFCFYFENLEIKFENSELDTST